MSPSEDSTDPQEANRVEGTRPLEEVLAPLNRAQLQALLLGLAKSTPELAGRIEARALALQSVAPPEAAAPPAPASPAADRLPPPDVKLLTKQVRAAVRAGGYGRGYGRGYDYGAGSAAAAELSGIADQAQPYLEAGDGRGALMVLQVVAEELTDGLDDILDEEGEVAETLAELGTLLAEAILTADLSREERDEWLDRIEEWENRAAEYGLEVELQVARYAADQGWEYLPLCRVLEGEITEQGAWEDYRPACADALADVRLTILERRGRWDEVLRLAQAENRTERYLKGLVHLGRIGEAVDYGLKTLGNRLDALEFAQVLEAAGATEEALRIAEHGLAAFEAGPYSTSELAAWTRNVAARLGHTERALAAALTAVRERPNLDNYTAVAPLAGEQWPVLREELLELLRRRKPYDPSDEVDIFLHEGLIEDAMAVVDASPRHVLVERVVEAALPAHADWAFRACTHQFDRIADAGKAQYYWAAAQWLEKAKEALRAAGREAEWRAYINGVIDRHSRKRNLRPMLERLR
jgi:uncharacterized Zn finger protein